MSSMPRRDANLLQEIHLHIWRSFDMSLNRKTWGCPVYNGPSLIRQRPKRHQNSGRLSHRGHRIMPADDPK